MSAAEPKHLIFVRAPNGRKIAVGVRPIIDFHLACRAADLLAAFLALESDEYTEAARWAFEVRDALTAGEVDLRACVVEVVRQTISRTAKRRRTVACRAVANWVEPVAKVAA